MVTAPWHLGSVNAQAQRLRADIVHGLTAAEAARRLKDHGPNQLTTRSRRSLAELLVEQFRNLLVVLLLLASILSFFLGSFNDGIVLLTIVMINALVGFLQDWKSENIVARLGSLVTDTAIAVRDGRRIEVPTSSLVPGDLVWLQEGEGVPADCRIVSGESIMANEMALTGESVAAEKDAGYVTDTDVPLPERRNSLFFGTTLARGEVLCLVCETGDHTELGRIAVSSQSMDREASPLQKELNILGQHITRNEMTITSAFFEGLNYRITGHGYNPQGEIFDESGQISA